MTHYILGNDYTVEWPLGTDANGACAPDRPVLSSGLRTELLEWAASFNSGYSPETGWESEREFRAHRRWAELLVRRVASELPEGDSIELRYWETIYKQSTSASDD